MFKHDLVGINFDDNTDEYDAEAGTVIPRLASCSSVEDLARVLHEEFLAWFGAETAGEVSAYRALANEIWQLKRNREA
jgi:phosphatidylserine/phosphatidylglycerophosphate/cardiolipin synthase-like enzyme